MRRVDLALSIARSHLGTFYSWGGDDPSGFDCSGFVIEVLKSVGLIERKIDLTADMLWQRFINYKITEPTPGCLAFRQSGNKMVHVEIVIEKIDRGIFTIGASGGTKKTKTREDAIRDNAFIKIRPAVNFTAYVNPFWSVSES